MQRMVTDDTKMRLETRRDIETAIDILKTRGWTEEQLVREITKMFYVDLDTYNEVIRAA